MSQREREILEHTVQVLTEQAVAASKLVDEAMAAGLGGSHPVTIHAKMLQLELIETKAAVELSSVSSSSTARPVISGCIG